jgi:hypothetical protein
MPLAFPKPESLRSKLYIAWIHLFPCLVCNRRDVEAAHTGEHGLRTKAPDIQVVPLCVDHHRGVLGLDRIGPQRFEELYNVDLKAKVLQFINRYIVEHIENGRVRF